LVASSIAGRTAPSLLSLCHPDTQRIGRTSRLVRVGRPSGAARTGDGQAERGSRIVGTGERASTSRTVGVEHDRLQAIEGKAWPVRLGHVRIIVCQFSRDFVRCPDMYLACAVTLGVG
jgi:hypothetical protein